MFALFLVFVCLFLINVSLCEKQIGRTSEGGSKREEVEVFPVKWLREGPRALWMAAKKKKRKEKNNLFENLEKYKQVTGDYTKTIESE